MRNASEIKNYLFSKKKSMVLTAAVVALVLTISIYSLSVNSFKLSFVDAWEVFVNRITGNVPVKSEDYTAWIKDYVVMEQSAPRTLAAVLIGIILAVSGAVMQSLTRNPLTDPYTIGISSAAMLGFSIAVVYGVCIIPFLGEESAKIVNAFVFSLIPASAILVVSSFKKLSPMMMVLIGIGMMYMFSSFSTFIKFNASEESLQTIYEWGIGTLSDVKWGQNIQLFVAAVMVSVSFMLLSGRINVLGSGDKVAQNLGVNPIHVRIICFIMISVAVAVAVCYSGTIGFVGLVAPHIARLFTGNDNKVLIPASATIGALMIVFADTMVRLLPGGLPVGVITALVGSPLFIYFLYKQRRSANF